MSFINEFEVRETYDIGYIRRHIADQMEKLKFSDKEIAEISIVVSELCNNLIKHEAVEGKIRFLQIFEGNRTGIEIIVEDKGPGIENVNEMLKDGISCKGTMGGGFGAMRRLSDFFEIDSYTNGLGESVKQPGTTITIKKWNKATSSSSGINEADIETSVISRPFKGLAVNGDGYYIKSFSNREIITVIDGLGHGVEAFKAANSAIKTIDENTHKSAEEIMKTTNLALKNTRGAVMALFIIDKFAKEFEIISIGNVDCRHISQKSTDRLFSYNGYVGAYKGIYKTKMHSYKQGDMLVLCTDGISSKWEIENYADEITNNATVLCNTIFKEFSRENDDATILIAVL